MVTMKHCYIIIDARGGRVHTMCGLQARRAEASRFILSCRQAGVAPWRGGQRGPAGAPNDQPAGGADIDTAAV